MIIVCTCGQKSIVRDLSTIPKVRCAKCKTMLSGELHRQATRNANIVLELAAYLLGRGEDNWTKEEMVVAHILNAHEE